MFCSLDSLRFTDCGLLYKMLRILADIADVYKLDCRDFVGFAILYLK